LLPVDVVKQELPGQHCVDEVQEAPNGSHELVGVAQDPF
jgi:hypothetical protein